ncbi:MAG: hypothetical protein JOZ54_20840 [Acidobacteria bacterium]|nr:hypothetical protein [Acidobacteriota bacterium]
MRVIPAFALLLLLFAAVPSFAAPPCSVCDPEFNQCVQQEGAGVVCRIIDCTERFQFCNPAIPEQLAATMTIASVEVKTPATHTLVASNTKTAQPIRVAAK